MFRIDPRCAYAMPAHFGPRPIGKATGWYRDVTMMIVPYLTDREKLAAMLPEPFSVGEEPIVSVTYARNRKVDWLAGRGYNLIAVNASAVYQGKREELCGHFTLVMWENLADPILTGRELQGIPKVFADISDHTITDGLWSAAASHFGTKIVDLTIGNTSALSAELIEAGKAAQKGKDSPLGWRFMPGVNGFGVSVSEPTTFPSESTIAEAWVGEGRVDWNRVTWEQNPTQSHIVNALASLPIVEYRPSFITKGAVNLLVPGNLPRVLA